MPYKLFWNTRHLEGSLYDATLVPFDRWGELVSWLITDPREVPDTILFEADFTVTRQADYPSNDVNWPLMSRRMLDVICGVGEFSHRAVAVRLVDRTVPRSARYDDAHALRTDIVDDRFTAVQLLEHHDFVDWEQSRYRRSELNPAYVARFSKLVLKAPAAGFPPLFRLPSQASHLFASDEARAALEAAGVQGAEFWPLENLNSPPPR